MKYSQTQIYRNGNQVAIGKEGDHVAVRNILATGLVERVSNFGPLLIEKTQISADKVIVESGFELHIINKPEQMSFSLDGGLVADKDVNLVYYQRIVI